MGVLICLDPGHGGKDQGASGFSLREKDVCLDVSQRVEKKLCGYEGIQVTMTRSQDRHVSTKERTDWANKQYADLYLSFHTNVSPDLSLAGFSSYVSVFSGSKTRLIQRWLHNQIVCCLRDVGVTDFGKKNDTESFAGQLDELRQVQMPAIALGCLFISNPEDQMLLKDPQFLDFYASSVAEGISIIFHCPPKMVDQPTQVYDFL